ncbi:unnamed protein product [Caenorhabditis angaria]|uniref:Uncharacterized protein n=1 Tax=Caenorhabditis angaria TaxID=860376 RepID=A0A9P1MWJ8_9PELO|nr:unnamed protein product [Caenorhabditis angaria]
MWLFVLFLSIFILSVFCYIPIIKENPTTTYEPDVIFEPVSNSIFDKLNANFQNILRFISDKQVETSVIYHSFEIAS